jgi:hypothetical protein
MNTASFAHSILSLSLGDWRLFALFTKGRGRYKEFPATGYSKKKKINTQTQDYFKSSRQSPPAVPVESSLKLIIINSKPQASGCTKNQKLCLTNQTPRTSVRAIDTLEMIRISQSATGSSSICAIGLLEHGKMDLSTHIRLIVVGHIAGAQRHTTGDDRTTVVRCGLVGCESGMFWLNVLRGSYFG